MAAGYLHSICRDVSPAHRPTSAYHHAPWAGELLNPKHPARDHHRSAHLVKAFGMELWETRRFHDAARRLFRANLRSVSAAAVSSPMMDIFGAAGMALIILIGREYIKRGHMTEGIFVTFMVAVFKLYDPMKVRGIQ